MMSYPPTDVTIEFIRHCQDTTGSPAWAHISGWAQLSGDPRTVSCVVAAHNSARQLSHLLPELSDELTEAGQPWEIVVVDSASNDGTHALMTQWTDLPGFRWLRLSGHAGKDAAIAIGLLDARGDAVLLVDPASSSFLRHIPEMLAGWEAGIEVAYLDPAGQDGPIIRRWSSHTPDESSNGASSFDRPLDSSSLVLIDRTIVSLLLDTSADEDR